MNTTISLTIKNLIRNYCYNFLGYLYSNKGWTKTLLTGKENTITSTIPDKNIRILITHDGTIILTCYSMEDILKSIEFIIEQFQYGRMESYCVFDDSVNISNHFISVFNIDNDFSNTEKFVNNYGDVEINENVVTLKYNDYEKGIKLISIVKNMFKKEEKIIVPNIPISIPVNEINKVEEIDNDKKEETKTNLLVFSVLLLWLGVKIVEFI